GPLRELTLTRNDLAPRVPALSQPDRLPQLRRLHLADARIPSDAVGTFLASPVAAGLWHLSLRGVFVAGNEVMTNVRLPQPLAFRSLVLPRSSVSDRVVRAIASSPYLPELCSLDLWNGGMTDDGADALAASPHWVSLRILNLAGTQLSAAGARALAAPGR